MATRKYSNKRRRIVNRYDNGDLLANPLGMDTSNPIIPSLEDFGLKMVPDISDSPIPSSLIQKIPSTKSSGLGNLAIGAAAGTVGSIGGSLISGGLQSGAGNAISSIGSTIGGAISAVNPVVGGIVSGASGILGGVTNALFGSKLNKENIAKIESSNNALNTIQVDDSSTSSILNQFGNTTFGQNFSKGDIGRDGVFSHKAKDKYNELKEAQANAINRALGNFSNAASNVQSNQINEAMRNFASYGGPITMRYTGPMSPFGNTFADGGEIHIKKSKRGTFTAAAKKHGKSVQAFASQVLANKDNYSPAMVKKANFARNASKWHAEGGWLDNIHGGIFDNGVTTIGNGGTHEENPFEGVQMGVDEQGIPNLVEEGEVVYNDYVYSNRIKAPKEVKNRYKLRGNTFSDLATNAQKESEERPNDPISQRGLQDIMTKLAMEQESIREKKANRSRKYAHGGKLGTLYDGEGKSSNFLDTFLGGKVKSSTDFIYPTYPRVKPIGIWPVAEFGWDGLKALGHIERTALGTFNYFPDSSGDARSGDTIVPASRTTTRNNNRSNRRVRNSVNRPIVNDFAYTTNPLNMDRGINTADLYKQGSDYMNARQYVLDNWDTPYVQNWLNNYYKPFVTSYNKSRGYKGNFTVNRDQFEKGTYDSSFGGMHQGLLNFQYPGKNGISKFSATLSSPSDTNEGPIWQRGLASPTAAELGDIANEITGLNSAFGSAIPNNGTSIGESGKGKRNRNNGANPLTYLRYAPILGGAIGLTQSLLSKPDYSNADAILEASRDAGRYMPIGYKPIGNYLTYTPLDRDYYVNKLASQAGSTRRAITGQSAGNRATAMAGLLAADYNAQNSLGNLARQAAEYNFANRQAVETFNRATNQANSEMALKADMANQDAYARSAASRLSGTAQAMAMRQAIDDARNAGIAANFSNIFQGLGDIGREEVEASWVKDNPALYYYFARNGEGSEYKGEKKSYGGYITRKNKKKGGKR